MTLKLGRLVICMVYLEIEFETGTWKISDTVYLEIGFETGAWKISGTVYLEIGLETGAWKIPDSMQKRRILIYPMVLHQSP